MVVSENMIAKYETNVGLGVMCSSGYPGVVYQVDPMRGHSPSYW